MTMTRNTVIVGVLLMLAGAFLMQGCGYVFDRTSLGQDMSFLRAARLQNERNVREQLQRQQQPPPTARSAPTAPVAPPTSAPAPAPTAPPVK